MQLRQWENLWSCFILNNDFVMILWLCTLLCQGTLSWGSLRASGGHEHSDIGPKTSRPSQSPPFHRPTCERNVTGHVSQWLGLARKTEIISNARQSLIVKLPNYSIVLLFLKEVDAFYHCLASQATPRGRHHKRSGALLQDSNWRSNDCQPHSYSSNACLSKKPFL